MAQQGHRALGWQPGTKGRGSADCVRQARALHHIVAENAHQGGPGFASTQGRERTHRSHLLGHRMMQPESLETAAQSLERGHGLDQPAACSLGGQVAAVGRPDIGNGGDQCGISQLAWYKTWWWFSVWRGGSRRDPGSGKQIRLTARQHAGTIANCSRFGW